MYLGGPLSSGRLTARMFEPLASKIRGKVAIWKGRLLSQGGCLILIRHVLSCMATHTLAVLAVPKMVLRKINTILSSFLWGENNGKGKRKWCSWDKVCKPVSKGGVGVRDLAKVQKSFHMKFAWRLMTWTDGVVTPSQNDSRFWKSVLKVFPKVYENIYVKIKEGKASFWFDMWLSSGPLVKSIELVQRLALKVQECWESGAWDTFALEELKVGSNVFMWKPTTNGKFSTTSAREVIRIKVMRRPWMDWVWHKLLTMRDFWEELEEELVGFRVSFGHQFTEGNQVSDFLAWQGEEGSTRRYFEGDAIPSKMRGLMRMDKL
ncbi:hypothetical protein I3760_11G180000 [Carya illinoinensis]|nr:hypothetical protein I3760_11G180000 [Carya illinoinensis]